MMPTGTLSGQQISTELLLLNHVMQILGIYCLLQECNVMALSVCVAWNIILIPCGYEHYVNRHTGKHQIEQCFGKTQCVSSM